MRADIAPTVRHLHLPDKEAVKISLHMTVEQKDEIQKVARKLGITMSELIRQASASFARMQDEDLDLATPDILVGAFGTPDASVQAVVVPRVR